MENGDRWMMVFRQRHNIGTDTRFINYCLLLYLLFFISADPAFGFDDGIKFKRLKNENGLSKNTVYSTLQDEKGFMWFGSSDGIDRFDGYEFKDYGPLLLEQTGLGRAHVYSLVSDNVDNLWLSTEEGLCRFNLSEERFTLFKNIEGKPDSSLSNNYVTSLLVDNEGNLWVGTQGGLSRFDVEDQEFVHFEIPVYAGEHERNKPQGVYQDDQGIIWLGVQNGLWLFDPQQSRFVELPDVFSKYGFLDDVHVRVVVGDKTGRYWIGTENAGVFVYDPKDNLLKNLTPADGLASMMIRDIHQVGENEIWIGTRNGLSIYDVSKDKITNHLYDKFTSSSLSNNSVRSILSDRQNNVWVTTYWGGINIYHPTSNNFHTYREELAFSTGLSHPVVGAVVEDKDGNLWIGTEGGGLNYHNRTSGLYEYYVSNGNERGLSNDNVKALALDDLGNLWVGTYAGLNYLNTKTGDFKNFRYQENDSNSISHNIIQCLSSTSEGVWAGTNGGGLNFIKNSGEISRYVHDPADPNSLVYNNVLSLAQDNDGGLWIGTSRGLNYLKADRKNMVRVQIPLFQNSFAEIISLHHDGDRLWIGTSRKGILVYHISKGVFSYVGEKEGFMGSLAQGILTDAEGHVWVGTDKGLSKLKVHEDRGGHIHVEKILNFTEEDGLQGNQFKENACFQGGDGRLYFGGLNGLNEFVPERIVENTQEPSVYITDFQIKNKSVSAGLPGSPLEKHISDTEKVTLKFDEAFFTVGFTALNYISSGKNQYAFTLEGLKQYESWNNLGGQRSVTFTGLDPGKYVLKIIASNNDGVWTTEGSELEIEILPPYWKTWWAYTLYASILSCLLYVYYYYSQKAFGLEHDLALEHLSRENEKELHQSKLRFFTNISHEIKTPLTLILAPIDNLLAQHQSNSKLQNQLMMMKRNGEHLTRLIQQLLDFRKLESGKMKVEMKKDNVVSFLHEIFVSFKGYAWDKNINFEFHKESDDIPVYFDKDKLEKVFYNLLSNAFKFTPDHGSVKLSVATSEKKVSLADGSKVNGVEIVVEDNGIGIPRQDLDKVFERFHRVEEADSEFSGTGIGLAFTKELVEQHFGAITVDSREPALGMEGFTRFCVTIPLDSPHLTENQIAVDAKPEFIIPQIKKAELANGRIAERKSKIMEYFENEQPKMLVVEDNLEMQSLIVDFFVRDFDMAAAPNGLVGYESAVKHIPDIIISDVMMPLMDGIELAAKIKNDPFTSHIPLILLTARTPLLYKIEGLETGADDYITKPFDLNLLEARVWNLLESRQKLRVRYQKELILKPENIAINSADETFFDKIMTFIEENIAEPTLSVEEMGKYVGMSRVHLYRKIKAATGFSVVELMRRVRLQRAGQLLAENKFNVFEVAYMVGFQDQDYFRKCFKEFYGMTPTAYSAKNKSAVAGEEG